MDAPNVVTSPDRWRTRFLKTWTLIGLAALVVAGLWLLSRFAGVLTPFVFAGLVVFLLRRPVANLTRRGLSRGWAVGVCYLVMLSVLSFVGVVVMPPLVKQIGQFLGDFPRHFLAARDLWFQLQGQYTTLEVPTWLDDAIHVSRDDLARQAATWSRTLASGVVFAGGQVFTVVLNLFLSLALAFFVLRDLPVLKSEMLLLGGVRRRADLLEVFERVTLVVEGWIRGQTLIAVIVGTLTGLGLAILGVPYALVIGIIAGVSNLIPYLGPIVGGLIAAISAAFVSPTLVLYTIIYIVVLQQLESIFLQPRVMSDQVNMHPVLVVLSLLVGASVGGLFGMLLAVPVAGALNAVFVYYFEKHTASELATEDGALFRKTGCEDAEPCPEPNEAPERPVTDKPDDNASEDEERS